MENKKAKINPKKFDIDWIRGVNFTSKFVSILFSLVFIYKTTTETVGDDLILHFIAISISLAVFIFNEIGKNKFMEIYHYQNKETKTKNIGAIMGIIFTCIIGVTTTILGGSETFDNTREKQKISKNILDSLNHVKDSLNIAEQERKNSIKKQINKNIENENANLTKFENELNKLNKKLANTKSETKQQEYILDIANYEKNIQKSKENLEKLNEDLSKPIENNIKFSTNLKNIEEKIDFEKKSIKTSKNDDFFTQILFGILTFFIEGTIFFTNFYEINFNYRKEIEEEILRDIELEKQNQNNENEFFENCKRQNLIRDFNNYLEKYPKGRYVLQANENILWLLCERENSSNSYKKFIEKYPDGHFANIAHEKIKLLLKDEELQNQKLMELEVEKQEMLNISTLIEKLYKKYSKNDNFSLSKAYILFEDDMDKTEIQKFIESCKKIGLIRGNKRGQKIVLSKSEAMLKLKQIN